MRTCFATVIYKQAKPYLQDLINSVDNQSDKDFDLLIINDNYTTDELKELPLKAASISGKTHVVDLQDRHLSIAGTRIEMLRVAKAMGYDLIIMGDADDTFSADRVAQCKRAAELDKQSVFFYNKLVTDKDVQVFKTIPNTVDSVKQISQVNFLGMSTSAINLNKLSEDFIASLSEGDCPVFDWYLFSRILMDVGRGSLVDNAATIYRIYDNNEVGLSRDIKKEYDVKLVHYTNLAKRYDYFRYLLDQLQKLDLDEIKHKPDHQGYWWSDIQMEDSYEI